MLRRVALVAVLALVATGCSTQDRGSDEQSTSNASASPSGSPSASGSAEPSDRGDLPEPGTAEEPAELTAEQDLLEWSKEGDPLGESVTVGSAATIRVSTFGEWAEIEGAQTQRIRPPRGLRVSTSLLDEDYAVIVSQDPNETKPAAATIVDLASGQTRTVDGSSELATLSGGGWTMGQGRLFYPTTGRDDAYCLAEFDLASGDAQTTYCAEPRTGFNQVRITPEGLSLLSFDDAQPSCRTVLSVGEAGMEPFLGVPQCQGWEGMLMPEGAIWSVVEDENSIEAGRFRARVGDGYYDLGSGLTGSLTYCDGAAYFSRNQESDTGPARLMRWDGTSLAVVMEEGEGGPSQMSAPRCGGGAITISVLAEKGDRQLSAPLD